MNPSIGTLLFPPVASFGASLESYFSSLDFSRISSLIAYDPHAPMLFSSGIFLVLFLLFLPFYRCLRSRRTLRILFVSLFSLFFYYKSGGWYFLLLLFVVSSDFIIGKKISSAETRLLKKRWLTLGVMTDLAILGFFKYFNFIGDALFNLATYVGGLLGFESCLNAEWREVSILLPVGISFFTFQSISYIVDLYRGDVKPIPRWLDYLFYISFFPQLVAGPIVRAKDFIPQIYRKPRLSRGDFGRGLVLVMVGLFKKAVISDYISVNFVDRVFDAPGLYTGLENLLASYGYTLQIYCDFSGYSDMAIGIALFLGFRFHKNFDVPFNSSTITEFWRRWHISLSSWLRDYLYIPLGGNRKGRIRTYANLLITMLLGGLWHGAAWQFILWGGLHGVALALHKAALSLFPRLKSTGRKMKRHWRIAGAFFTFHFVVFAFIFFRAKDLATGWEVVVQIFQNFHPEVFLQFIVGYSGVFSLLVLGYILHFLPRRLRRDCGRWVVRAPFGVQLFFLVALVFIVFQMKSADVQPFIYFQF